MAIGRPAEEIADADLPIYVIDAGTDRAGRGWGDRDKSSGAGSRTAVRGPFGRSTMAHLTWTGSGPSPRFIRLLDVPGVQLGEVLNGWWSHRAGGTGAAVAGGLVLTAPHVEDGGWRLVGHLRRGLGRRSVPVVVDLWAYNGWFTRLELAPRVRVVPSRRYFRQGHRALDLMGRQLVARGQPRQRAGDQRDSSASTVGTSSSISRAR